jgi:hypothetical protein
MWMMGRGSTVITRLHVRYAKDSLGDDLVFKAAGPIVGGREMPGRAGALEKGATPAPFNNFQARYAIRHAWTGPIACEHPVRGRWGGPPGNALMPTTPQAASKLAFAPRGGMKLAFMVREDIPEIGVTSSAGDGAAAAPSPSPSASARPATSAAPAEDGPTKPPPDELAFIGCSVGTTSSVGARAASFASVIAALALVARRRRKSRS